MTWENQEELHLFRFKTLTTPSLGTVRKRNGRTSRVQVCSVTAGLQSVPIRGVQISVFLVYKAIYIYKNNDIRNIYQNGKALLQALYNASKNAVASCPTIDGPTALELPRPNKYVKRPRKGTEQAGQRLQ